LDLKDIYSTKKELENTQIRLAKFWRVSRPYQTVSWFRLPPATKPPRCCPSPHRGAEENGNKTGRFSEQRAWRKPAASSVVAGGGCPPFG